MKLTEPRNTSFLLIIVCCGLFYSCNKATKNNDDNNSAINTSEEQLESKAEVSPENKPIADEKGGDQNDVSKFIPENYSELNLTKGDLNLDGIEDIILVLKKNNEEETSDASEHPEKRPLYILLGQSDNTYELAAKNDNVVYCVDCGGVMGDPFANVVIKNGYFSVEHYGGSAWRWTKIITFKYSKVEKNWFLHRDGGESFSVNEPDKVESTIKTVKDFGVVPFESYSIYEN